jgi:hypothetical protein
MPDTLLDPVLHTDPPYATWACTVLLFTTKVVLHDLLTVNVVLTAKEQVAVAVLLDWIVVPLAFAVAKAESERELAVLVAESLQVPTCPAVRVLGLTATPPLVPGVSNTVTLVSVPIPVFVTVPLTG